MVWEPPTATEPGLVEKLFPEGYVLRAWQTASLFGNRGNFREAAQLGERVFRSLTTQRARYGIELAHWHLNLGEIDTARRYLRESLDTPGESYDAPVYSALREYFLLIPAVVTCLAVLFGLSLLLHRAPAQSLPANDPPATDATVFDSS